MATVAVAVALLLLAVSSSPATPVEGGGWDNAHATFYGDDSGGETMQGACGYDNVFRQGYGWETTALSVAMFAGGWSCGGCYEIRCQGSSACRAGAAVAVTATNLCPANYSKPYENWCNPPLKHFDLSKKMFIRLVTDFRVGIVPVAFRRVPCGGKSGGVRFEMKGNLWWVTVLVFNVGGAGDVRAMAVRGSRDGRWMGMSRNWGMIWNGDVRLEGEGLSFRVATSDGRAIVFGDVVPPTWTVGQTFQGNGQF
ncbi:expansin-A4-like [Oryza brachyantha]|uniref:Expansin n=1 Tax=Oryza brachyantha TaxID=4533 RepID=J3MPU9_ORYBR|nr:expansin-A4-like [Oryza brachyantha]